MGELSDAALKAVFSINRSWSDWAVLAVLVGLGIELVVLFLESKGKSWLERIGLALGTVIIIAGVYGEYRFGGKSADAAAELQRRADIEVGNLRNENLTLEKQVQPRRLSADDTAAITAALKAFSGKGVAIESYFLDVEAAELGSQIAGAFSGAGIWIDDGRLMTDTPLGAVALGVHVSGSDERLVNVIVTALHAARVSVEADPDRVPTGVQFNVPERVFRPDATVFVGVKPVAP